MKDLILDVKTLIVLVALAVFGLAHADSVTYTYDNLGRITGATYANGAAVQYSYDSNGNRTTLNVTAPTNLPQTISFGAAPTVSVGGSGTVSATGGPSGNPVIFTSQTTGVCSISGSTVYGLTAGTCTIAANQAGNANYNAAPQVTQSFNIGLGSQTINFGTAPTLVVGGTGIVWATGGLTGNPVTFSSLTTGVCTINGSFVTGVTAGTCTIAANQAGNANYNAAPQTTQSFNIGTSGGTSLANQTISYGTAPTVVVGGTGTVSATGGTSGNPVTFTSQTTGVCTISGNTVTGVTVGICTIAANQAGNANYNAAPQVTQSFTVRPGSQTLAPTDCLLNWAEQNYPGLFAPAGATTAVSGIYTYRHYSATNAYVGVSSVDGHVYYLGPDGVMQDEGTLYNWLPKASCPVPTPTDCLFNWAETNYPSLFAPAGATTTVSGGYTSRYYSGTNAYLRVSSTDNHVYYMGSDGVMQDEGPLSNWLPLAGCQ